MTEDELAECLITLLGRRHRKGGSELDTCDPTGSAALTEEIPAEITTEVFVADILSLPIAKPEKKNRRKENNL